MKTLHFILLLTILQLPTLAISANLKQIPVSSQITAVTVYPDRAMTKRSATLSLKPGSYLISFEKLPALILEDSVRVEGHGTASTAITGLEIKRVFLEQSGEKLVQAIQAEILALEQHSAMLAAKKTGLTAQKAFLESIRVAWGERISKELAIGRPTAAELREAAGFVGTEIAKTEEQSSKIDFDKKSIKDKIDALQHQLNEATGSGRKETKTVEVAVEIAREGSLTLELTSMTPQARWEPTYDVRLSEDAKSAELTFRAMLRQQTGEEWHNVDVTLSTARPAIGGAPPELYPWEISLYNPQQVMAERAMAAPAMMSSKARGRLDYNEQAEEAPATLITAQVSSEQSSVSFHVPGTLNIPSDGSSHGSVVAVEKVPVNIEYLAVPKLSPVVFLRSEIVNRAQYPLLPGKVNTFVGNSYTGSSHLKKVAAGEKFELYFGSDDQVTVKREQVKQQKEAGLFGKNRFSYRYRIEVGNFRKEPLTLTLRDQLPIATDEEIKVSLDDPSIKPDEVKNDGTLTWKLPLKAGEKRELNFGVVIEYPKDRTISGL